MNRDNWKRTRARAGFSLMETMITVLILLMVSSVVAAGVPLAMNAYRAVLNAANAEVLLSSTVTRLRDELGEATDIAVGDDNASITFTGANGFRCMLYLGGEEGIMLRETVGEEERTRALVSRAASNQNLHTEYSGAGGGAISYSDGVIVINNLSVKNGADVLTSLSELRIRVLADVVS